LQAARLAQAPDKHGPDGKDQKEGPADGAQQHPERGQARRVVDEGDAEREQHPADDVVADAGGQHGDADVAVQEVELRQDAAEDGKGRDGERGADKERKDAKVNVVRRAVVIGHGELVVQAPGEGDPEAERERHAGEPDDDGGLDVFGKQPDIQLEGDEKEKHNEAERRNVVEHGHRLGGKDVGLEARDAHHDRRAEYDAANDLGDDARLLEQAQGVCKGE
jgi:hypothetical protein